jgi:hypothetical protein
MSFSRIQRQKRKKELLWKNEEPSAEYYAERLELQERKIKMTESLHFLAMTDMTDTRYCLSICY